MPREAGRQQGVEWLVLVHQIPTGLASLRTKIWRRLQGIGSVAIKNSMYVLLSNEEAREDFAWILKEIKGGGAEGAILSARVLEGMSDGQIRDIFDAARNEDYAALAEEIRRLPTPEMDGAEAEGDSLREEIRQALPGLRKKAREITSIDYFGATGRVVVEGLLSAMEKSVSDSQKGGRPLNEAVKQPELEKLKGRVWVTRKNVYVDRIASAWLIKRWIDEKAVFKFTGDTEYTPSKGEVRFDMFDAEFTHIGEMCTFEVLVREAKLDDLALERIAQIVHDIDLKDHRYGLEETPGVVCMFDGIVAGEEDDQGRIDRGLTMLDDLYRSFQGSRR